MTKPFLAVNRRREISRIVWSSIIFVLAVLIGKKIGIYTVENAITPVLGLYFGAAGALGVGIGSIFQSIIYNNVQGSYVVMKFIVAFFYAYAPYKLWYTFNIKDKCDIPNLNNIKSILRYIYLTLIDFAAVYIMNELIDSLYFNNQINFDMLLLNIFNDFNYIIMIGVAVLIAISTTDIKPSIPKSSCGIKWNMHYDILIYVIIICEALCVYYVYLENSWSSNDGIVSYSIAASVILMILFILAPIGNKANIVEISKMRGVFSLKGKVTIGFLIFSIIFISALGIITHLAFSTTLCGNYEIYKKINLLIGLSGYFIFALTLIVLQYVQSKITEPIQILFYAVENFTKTKYENNVNDEELIKKCNSIKTGDEIEELAIAFGKMMKDIKAYMKNLSTATARIEKEAAELTVARKIQESVLPHTLPKNDEFEIYASINPAKEVSGDFYDFFIINDRYLVFLIADVSGKGVPAALFMMTAKTTIKNLFSKYNDISEAIFKVNNALCENNDTLMFVTAFISIIDLETGIMSYINAGHNPPLIKKDGKPFDYMSVKNNCILAIMPNAEFEKQTIQLKKGDMIFVYTDGITEAMNKEGSLFGVEKLKNSLNKEITEETNIYDIVPLIENHIAIYRDGQEQNDDITMLAFRFHGKDKNE